MGNAVCGNGHIRANPPEQQAFVPAGQASRRAIPAAQATGPERPHAGNHAAGLFEEAARAGLARQTRVATAPPHSPGGPNCGSGTFARNMSFARDAIVFARAISTVSQSRISHIHQSVTRDAKGAIVSAVKRPMGPEIVARMDDLRRQTVERSQADIKARENSWVPMTPAEQSACVVKYSVDTVRSAARHIPPHRLPTNCFEQANLAFDHLARLGDNPHLDVVSLKNTGPATAKTAITGEPSYLYRGPEHVFLVIGRDPATSNPERPETWGEDTVVCDPWAERHYAAVTLREEMALLSSTTNGSTDTISWISLNANTPYDPDPTVLHTPG